VVNRYDLKNANAQLELEGKDGEIVAESSDEYTLGQALDVLRGKLVRRGVDLKSLRPGKIEPASGGRARQRLTFQQGIPGDTAKAIVAEIKKLKLKVQGAIQGDSVRVSGKNRDDLQKVIAQVKGMELDVPVSFTNYRST
jgi:cyclic-di-GMP-binding protein